MAVAAYASLVSLTHVLDNVHYRAELRRLHVDIKQIEDLQGRVNFLLEFVEVHSEMKGEKIEGLWKQMSEVAIEAEEVFDLHVVSQLQLETKGKRSDLGFVAFTEDIVGLIQKIDVIENDLLAVKKVLEDLRIGEQPRVSEPTGGLLASASSPSNNNTIVGFDDHVVEIKEMLARDESTLRILPIVGMGGIGKTTLAKKVFDDPYIVQHFDLRIWLTISQKYTVHEILTGLLHDGEVKLDGGNLDGLGEALYKKLYGRRYLIVMDDVWTEQAWSDLRMFFPNNFNRSRVIMTTRLSHVANSLGSHNLYSMMCLSENESWNLFCQTIFTQKDCPYPELEEIGKEIVESCKGLPLEIIVIGGLCKSDMRKEHWKIVSNNVSSLANSSKDEHCLKILRLSYDSLPIHLKLCFLSMRVIREDTKFPVSNLIEYWLVEDYIKIKEEKCLEEIGREYVKDLVDRNLIFIDEWTSNGEIRTCGIHDLIRDLCLTESDKEHFLCFPRMEYIDSLGMLSSQCFICTNGVADKDKSYLGATVLISPSISQDDIPAACGRCKTTYSHTKELRWVKVLYSDKNGFPAQHTKLRLLEVLSYSRFVSPPMIHFLWNLQTLILHNLVHLQYEIWEMPQLRKIQAPYVGLPDPPIAHNENEDFVILKNLYSLGEVFNFKCTNEVLNRIPNLKELEVVYAWIDWSEASLCNFVRFQKLESLSLLLAEGFVLGETEIAFPFSLKRLSMKRCNFSLSGMSIIGSLPNLENLYLDCAANGSMWNPIEGEFLRLKELSIKCKDLVQWTVEESHFPNLELLELRSLRSLEEIPLGIGDIPTLRKIMLHKCSISAINSAHRIWEDQQSMGNETLEILVSHNDELLSISDVMSTMKMKIMTVVMMVIHKILKLPICI